VKRLPPHLRSVSPAELAERLAAERRGAPFLLYLDGDDRQHIVDLGPARGELSIGRDEASDIPLEWDTEVSRAHAMLERIGGAWTLVDDGLSRNGSSVNGRRVYGRRRLDDGDAILVGRTQLVFVASPGKAQTTATSRFGSAPELSPAQRRVLNALCAPLLEDQFAAPPSNREIAAELFLGVETVKSHLHALFELFGVGDMPQNRKRAELVRQAFERGAVLEPSRSR
jgi:pSer/pThr/pTyr-binding forkhead associated (FHA) protein